MSGPLGSQQWMYSTGFYPYEIDQSLRFNDDDSAHLSRTPASAGNRKTWTWSGWVKRGNIGSTQVLFTASNSNSAIYELRFINDGGASGVEESLQFEGPTSYYRTVAVHRDPSAWGHFVFAFDSTQANAADRMKMYHNGVYLPPTGLYTAPSLNEDTSINATLAHSMGKRNFNSSLYFDGYLAEVNFIDGQALDATSFGEFKSGVWIPKSYSGSYGTNGFYLDFGNSGSLGADSSGNGNNWTLNNLAATDQVSDSPTNSFCTLNPLAKGSNITLSNGNLQYTQGATTDNMVLSTMGVSSGKWYAEMRCGTKSNCGIATNSANTGSYLGSDVNGWSYYVTGNGNIYHNGSNSAYGSVGSQGDVVGIALDLDAGTLTFYLNNVSQGTAVSGLADNTYFICMGLNDTSGSVYNYGQDSSFAGTKTAQGNTDANGIGDFYYAPPSGYLALCTANLPDPAIDPAQDDVPEDYFNTVLYTGNNSTQSITGVGFQPDWTWIKARNTALMGHILTDAVRGVGKTLISNATNAEDTNHEYGYLSVFDSDGFTVTAGSTNADRVNNSSYNYVAWNWLADNTSGSTNTDGTITSTVSANQKAGFSIQTWTGDASGNATVGHGLSQAPEFIIIKPRTEARNWLIWHKDFNDYDKAMLFDTGIPADNRFGPSAPTSLVYGLYSGQGNRDGTDFVGYAFHSVEGFSKFGSYTGNGSTDGPFVYTGFRPAFVMIKVVDLAGGHWAIHDSGRDEFNESQKWLFASSSSAEQTTTYSKLDLLSNGFKIKSSGGDNVNYSGYNFIYMAFAEMPFKYSNAR